MSADLAGHTSTSVLGIPRPIVNTKDSDSLKHSDYCFGSAAHDGPMAALVSAIKAPATPGPLIPSELGSPV